MFLMNVQKCFEVQKTDLMQEFRNSLQSVSVLCHDVSSKILVENFWTKNEYCQEFARVSYEDLQKFVSKFFRKMKVHVLVQGNMTKNQVEQAVVEIENALSCEPIDYVSQVTSFNQINNFDRFDHICRNTNKNCADTKFLWGRKL
jgi:secreted Zn-dependent insulinase-like peptidase